MFGTIVDKLQALLSRNFLIAVFFPVLNFVVVSMAVSYVAFPGAAQVLQAWWAAGLISKAEDLAGALIVVAVLAYTLSPLTVLSRRALEADFPLLSKLARRLRDAELESAKALNTQVNLAIGHLTQAERVTTQLLSELPRSRAVGCSLNSLTDKDGINRASKQIEDFALARRSWKPAGIATPEAKTEELRLLEDAWRTLDHALTSNSANLGSTQTAATNTIANQDIACSEELQHAYMAFRAQCKDYLATARHDAAEYAEEQSVRFPPSNIRATKFANIRCAAESYSNRTYAVEFEYLWPRMQFVLAKDDKGGGMVDLAKTQVDYSVLLLTLAVIFFVVWLPLLCIFGSSPLMFLFAGLVAPPVILILYQLALDSQRLFGSLLRATIDRYRLDVLTSLSLPPPGSLAVERQRWSDLQRATSANGLVDLPLRVAPK